MRSWCSISWIFNQLIIVWICDHDCNLHSCFHNDALANVLENPLGSQVLYFDYLNPNDNWMADWRLYWRLYLWKILLQETIPRRFPWYCSFLSLSSWRNSSSNCLSLKQLYLSHHCPIKNQRTRITYLDPQNLLWRWIPSCFYGLHLHDPCP